MSHRNYFNLTADSYYELGQQEGKLFQDKVMSTLAVQRLKSNWEQRVFKARELLPFSETALPDLIQEMKGYAHGAAVDFFELWAISLETDYSQLDKCTTIITNDGMLIGHNEDWDAGSKDSICVLRKQIQDLTIFELFYFNTLGGNSISMNSHGIVQAINSLSHTDSNRGIPRNLIARWMSETADPEQAFTQMQGMNRSEGYNHNLINRSGKIVTIESTATQSRLSPVTSPFVHTNHYLGELTQYEANDNQSGTFERYAFASHNVRPHMTNDELQALLGDTSNGSVVSVFNERTIARMIIDLTVMKAFVWLLREKELGWVEYEV